MLEKFVLVCKLFRWFAFYRLKLFAPVPNWLMIPLELCFSLVIRAFYFVVCFRSPCLLLNYFNCRLIWRRRGKDFNSSLLASLMFAGYDPVILGFSRYRMVGDGNNGVYDLQIRNVSLEDDAEYECQVGPYRPAGLKPIEAIRASANLTVLCKYYLNFINYHVNKLRYISRRLTSMEGQPKENNQFPLNSFLRLLTLI